MLKKLSRISIWLAGVDEKILNDCVNTEKIKHKGIGTLILIPSMLGFVSMSFAISTLTENVICVFLLSVLWAIIIVIIDRFLISSFKKSSVLIKDILSFSFFIRLLFSFGIGITVSHPLVLAVLDSTIQQNLNDDFDTRRKKIVDDFKFASDSIIGSINQSEVTNIKPLEAELSCVLEIVAAEFNGDILRKQCGSNTYETSGRKGFSRAYIEFKNAENTIRDNLSNAKESFLIFRSGQLALLEEKRKQKDSQLLGLQKFHSKDYLSRTIALEKLENLSIEGFAVSSTKIFLIVFFIFLDILPFFLKVSLPFDEYDFKVQKAKELGIYLADIDFYNTKDTERLKRECKYIFQVSKLNKIPFNDFKTFKDMDDFLKSL